MKVRSFPMDKKGRTIRPECKDPAAIERDPEHNIVRRCEYRHASGRTCYRRWSEGRGPSVPCDVRERHMITPPRRPLDKKGPSEVRG